jgi:hypothetical protein
MSYSGMWSCVDHAGSPLADFSTLKMEAIRSFETSVNARSTQCHIPQDDSLHSHRSENLKSYKVVDVQKIINTGPTRKNLSRSTETGTRFIRGGLISLWLYKENNKLRV